MEPPGDLPDVFQRFPQAFRDTGQFVFQFLVTAGNGRLGQAGLQVEPQQPLLQPVMQIALDAAPGSLAAPSATDTVKPDSSAPIPGRVGPSRYHAEMQRAVGAPRRRPGTGQPD
jgi:hypothetical protein